MTLRQHRLVYAYAPATPSYGKNQEHALGPILKSLEQAQVEESLHRILRTRS